MATVNANCSCGCNPCECVPPPDAGCVSNLCKPRPCFFDGQVIGSEDLNAIVGYAGNDSIIASRFGFGWGILAGLKVDSAVSDKRSLATGVLAQLSPNPQIIAGTSVLVAPGVAIDAGGQKVVLCEPTVLDLYQLAQQAPEGTLTTGPCDQVIGPFCDSQQVVTVASYFLVAEYVETPARPAPKFSGGGPCDPSPTCDFSRKDGQVKFSLVTSIPDNYQFAGCLNSAQFQLPDISLGTDGDGDLCRDEVFAYIDNIQAQLAADCCTRPAIVLARVSITSNPGDALKGTLPDVPRYVVIDDSYPCRKLTAQTGETTRMVANLICSEARTVISELWYDLGLGSAQTGGVSSAITGAGPTLFIQYPQSAVAYAYLQIPVPPAPSGSSIELVDFEFIWGSYDGIPSSPKINVAIWENQALGTVGVPNGSLLGDFEVVPALGGERRLITAGEMSRTGGVAMPYLFKEHQGLAFRLTVDATAFSTASWVYGARVKLRIS